MNAWGAPDTLSNALGQRTRLSRSNSAFPALVTKVVAPGGFETRAFFNSRALIDSTVAVNPYGNGSNAKTTFAWNPVWNRADSVIDPTGRRTRTFYRTTRPIVDSVRTGTNVSRRVKFTYTSDNQLRSVTEAGGVPDSITYDSFGNAEKTWTPLGRASSPQYFTQLYKDAIGRDTLVKYLISSDTGTTKIRYDVADRVIRTISAGPARPYTLTLSGYTPDAATIDALSKTDSSGYDAEGNLTFKNSVGSPSSSEVQVNESLVYDAAGRLRRRLIGTGPDSMVYDPAGNLISARHRSGVWVTQSFDVLNRLATRVIPEVVHGREQCNNFEPAQPLIDLGTNCHVVFPYYPNSGTSLRIPADTARFVYDAVTGEMREANNRYARVRRSYYPGGALKTDTTALGLYSSPSVDGLTRGQQYSYDLSGRRTSMDWYLGPTSYQYNDFGALELITDQPNNKQYRITYDLKGQVDSLILASGAKEKRTYDHDSRLISKNRVSTVGAVGTLVSDVLGYDKMNRVISVTEQVQQQQPEQTRISYDGLGGVLAKETSNGLGARVEEFRNDALGNVVRRLTRRTAGLINDAPFAMTYYPTGEFSSAFANPSDPTSQNQRKDQLLQQFASGGQLIRQQQRIENKNNNTVEFQSAARHYYGADDRLMAVERYSYRSLSVLDGTWEDYWYDALGRRVLTHARRESGDTPPVSFAYKPCTGSIQCRSFTERVWWDGDNSLVEERTPEGASSDVSNSGLIGNIHGLSLDEPLAVITLGENTRIINYNWRGQGMSSVFTDGSAGDISLGNTSTEVDWPASTQAETYFARSPDAAQSNNPKRWLGTFVANGQGTTGMLYRRNRYFDPKSGQFTQADPIGIAGGMNAFGFANGDPINFSDPFGLCTVSQKCWTGWGSLVEALGLSKISMSTPKRSPLMRIGGSMSIGELAVSCKLGDGCEGGANLLPQVGASIDVSIPFRSAGPREPGVTVGYGLNKHFGFSVSNEEVAGSVGLGSGTPLSISITPAQPQSQRRVTSPEIKPDATAVRRRSPH